MLMYSAEKIQKLLRQAGYYNGQIDGDVGPKTRDGIDKVLWAHENMLAFDPGTPDYRRRGTAAAQIIMHYAGFAVGAIDGWWGNQTEGAYLEWSHGVETGEPLVLDRISTRDISSRPQSFFPTQSACPQFYGEPGEDVESQLVFIESPYPLRLDWDLDTEVTHFRLHSKCAAAAEAAMYRIRAHYGETRIMELGLDRFAGSYNHRRMRGGTAWSMHAYGCAIDWFAGPNGLTTRAPRALFSHAEYAAFFDAWEGQGFISLGREIGRDYMHVQAARL